MLRISQLLAALAVGVLAIGGTSVTARDAAAAPPLEVYSALPQVSFVSLSPSGKELAFIFNEGAQRTLLVRTLAGETIHASKLGEIKLRDLRWAGDDHVIVFASTTAGRSKYKYEAGRSLILNVRDGTSFRVFERDPKVWEATAHTYGIRRIGGRDYAYFSGLSPSGRADLYRVDVETGATIPVARTGRRNAQWVLDSEGGIAARTDYDPATEQYIVLPGDTGVREAFRRKTEFSEILAVGLGRRPGTIVLADETGDERVYHELDLATGATTPLFEGEQIGRTLHDQRTGLLIGAGLAGSRRVIFLDPKKQARYTALLRAFPDHQIALVSHDEDLDHMIAYTEGDGDAGTYWTVDIGAREIRAFAQDRPALKPTDIGPVKLINYRAADGLDIEAVLTLPPGKKPENLPVVVMPHNAPVGGYSEVEFDWVAQAFASRGYAVIQPNYRGSGGRGSAFVRAGYGEIGRKVQTDISGSIDHLASQGIVDPGKACIVGLGYGGHAALLGVTAQRSIYRCAVSYGAPTDLGALMNHYRDNARSPFARRMRRAFGAEFAGDASLVEISPARIAGQVSAPILLMHGKDDTLIPLRQSEVFARLLATAGAPHEFERIEDADQQLLLPGARQSVLQKAVAFVEKHNPPN